MQRFTSGILAISNLRIEDRIGPQHIQKLLLSKALLVLYSRHIKVPHQAEFQQNFIEFPSWTSAPRHSVENVFWKSPVDVSDLGGKSQRHIIRSVHCLRGRPRHSLDMMHLQVWYVTLTSVALGLTAFGALGPRQYRPRKGLIERASSAHICPAMDRSDGLHMWPGHTHGISWSPMHHKFQVSLGCLLSNSRESANFCQTWCKMI